MNIESLIEKLTLQVAQSGNIRMDYSDIDQSAFAVYVTDAVGAIVYFNKTAEILWGRAPKLEQDKWCGSWDIFTPDGKFLPHDQCPMAQAITENRPIRGCEAIAVRPGGTKFRFQPFPTPLHDAGGKLIGGFNILVHLREENIRVDVPQVDIITRGDPTRITV